MKVAWVGSGEELWGVRGGEKYDQMISYEKNLNKI